MYARMGRKFAKEMSEMVKFRPREAVHLSPLEIERGQMGQVGVTHEQDVAEGNVGPVHVLPKSSGVDPWTLR